MVMKSLKKVFFCLALCLLATSVFAQESDENTNIMGGLDGVFDRADYEEQASNPEVAYAVVDQLVQSIGAGEITDLYLLDEETSDDEDFAITEELKDYVSANYKVKNNQGYSFVIIRSQSEEGIDGWIAFYHYSKKAKPADLYYIYYFCIEF